MTYLETIARKKSRNSKNWNSTGRWGSKLRGLGSANSAPLGHCEGCKVLRFSSLITMWFNIIIIFLSITSSIDATDENTFWLSSSSSSDRVLISSDRSSLRDDVMMMIGRPFLSLSSSDCIHDQQFSGLWILLSPIWFWSSSPPISKSVCSHTLYMIRSSDHILEPLDGRQVQLSVQLNCARVLRASQFRPSVTTRTSALLRIVQASQSSACILEPSHIAHHLVSNSRSSPSSPSSPSPYQTELQVLRVCAYASWCARQCEPAGRQHLPQLQPKLNPFIQQKMFIELNRWIFANGYSWAS